MVCYSHGNPNYYSGPDDRRRTVTRELQVEREHYLLSALRKSHLLNISSWSSHPTSSRKQNRFCLHPVLCPHAYKTSGSPSGKRGSFRRTQDSTKSSILITGKVLPLTVFVPRERVSRMDYEPSWCVRPKAALSLRRISTQVGN